MRLIYLASPYSHPDRQIQERRFRAVCQQAAKMMRAGELVFSPIAYTHPIVQCGLPAGWSFWQWYDRTMLERCDELAVLQLEGWDKSVGVNEEMAIARKFNIPMRYITPDEE